MSYRFTDPRKWQDPRFRSLHLEEKLLFFYLWECCDNAGFIPYDDQAASFHTGVALNRLPKTCAKLKDRIIITDEWIWVKDFPLLQKNWPLNPKNKCHTQIIRLLSERRDYFKDSPEFTTFIAPAEGLLCPLGIGNGNGSSNGFGRGLGNGIGEGRSQELEPINQELHEHAATHSNDFTSNAEKAEEEPPF
jgi:hypothetical protein